MKNKADQHPNIFKKTITILFCLIVFYPSLQIQGADSKGTMHIVIDGIDVPYDENYGFPFIDQNNRTQVPLRITLETFGATVEYDSNLKIAEITYKEHTVFVPIGANYVFVDGQKVMNDTAAVIYNNRTYCPIRIILESFGAEVTYDGTTASVMVSTPLSRTLYADGFDGNFKIPTIIPSLVFLVNYNDVPLSTTEEQWANFFFGNSKSVADYYASMSNDHLTLTPAKESFGVSNNGVIQVFVDTPHPNYTYENPKYTSIQTQPIFKNIVEAADSYINFNQYDINGDKYISSRELAISVIVAGDEESYYRTKTTKATSGVMVTEGVSTEADGVKLNWYTMSGEMYAQDYGVRPMSTLGVATHEFGHLLGLPDLYDLDYSTVGLGFHSLMASGNNNFNFDYGFGEYPAPMIAWSRMFAGLVEPYTVTESNTFTLYSESPYYNMIKVPTEDPKIYYLLENRQISDYGIAWNLYMDFGGIAIWKVNEYNIEKYNFDNKVESIDTERGITLIEAYGNNDLMKKELDIYYTRYNHYFNLNYINRWTSPEGIVIDVLDGPSSSMNVHITLPQ